MSGGGRAPGAVGRAGSALSAAVLALVVVGMLVTGGFYMAQRGGRDGVAGGAGTLAFHVAEQGLNEVLATWNAGRYARIPLWAADTVAADLPQGRYVVSVHHLTDRMYFLESEGRVPRDGRPAATHRVGVFARVQAGSVDPGLATPRPLEQRGWVDLSGGRRE